MQEDIKLIQNTIWGMYKEFLNTFDIQKYNEQASRLCMKYKDNPVMLYFCQSQILAYTPIINGIAERHRKGVNADDKRTAAAAD